MTEEDPEIEVVEPEVEVDDDEEALGDDEFEVEEIVLDDDDVTVDVAEEESAEMIAMRDAFRMLPALPDSVLSADPLTVYLTRLRSLPVLNAEDQQELAESFKEEGDIDAAKMLILSNLRLVVKIAREYRRRWTNLLELIQEGNVGLSEAIKRYDPYRNVKFTSYAQYWIRAMILNYLMNHFQPVKIGSTRAGRKLFYNLKKARAQLVREGHRNPTPALIAEKLGVKEKDVVQVAQHLDVPPLSLEQNAPGYDDTTVGDLLPDKNADTPEAAFADEEFQHQVRSAMEEFAKTIDDERDRSIWFERMIAEDPKTLSDLGDDYDVSKERIRQLEVRLKKKFKKFIMERLGTTLELYFARD